MSDKVCNNCIWFVEESKEIGDYSHEEAKRLGKGFCLVRNLFSTVEPADPACVEFKED